MSVILEFTIGTEDFRLGQVLSPSPDGMRLEIERIVPTGNMIMPFIWATGTDHAGFEKRVRDHPAVKELHVLDKIGDSGLYRIEWKGEPTDLIEAISKADAIILEARGHKNWVFRLRFPNHDKLSEFHNYIISQNIPIHIERTYTMTEETEQGHHLISLRNSVRGLSSLSGRDTSRRRVKRASLNWPKNSASPNKRPRCGFAVTRRKSSERTSSHPSLTSTE